MSVWDPEVDDLEAALADEPWGGQYQAIIDRLEERIDDLEREAAELRNAGWSAVSDLEDVAKKLGRAL